MWDRTLAEVYQLSSETSVYFYITTRHHIAEDSTLHSHRLKNLKSEGKTKQTVQVNAAVTF
jgi:hypothetical protein